MKCATRGPNPLGQRPALTLALALGLFVGLPAHAQIGGAAAAYGTNTLTRFPVSSIKEYILTNTADVNMATYLADANVNGIALQTKWSTCNPNSGVPLTSDWNSCMGSTIATIHAASKGTDILFNGSTVSVIPAWVNTLGYPTIGGSSSQSTQPLPWGGGNFNTNYNAAYNSLAQQIVSNSNFVGVTNISAAAPTLETNAQFCGAGAGNITQVTAGITGTTLAVSATTQGAAALNQLIFGTPVQTANSGTVSSPISTKITGGSAPNWTVNNTQTVASEQMYAGQWSATSAQFDSLAFGAAWEAALSQINSGLAGLSSPIGVLLEGPTASEPCVGMVSDFGFYAQYLMGYYLSLGSTVGTPVLFGADAETPTRNIPNSSQRIWLQFGQVANGRPITQANTTTILQANQPLALSNTNTPGFYNSLAVVCWAAANRVSEFQFYAVDYRVAIISSTSALALAGFNAAHNPQKYCP